MIKVYRYGLLPPTENATLVFEQMQKAHVYRNKLVEIERRRRAAQRELLSTLPSIAALEAAAKAADEELDAALAAVRRSRAATHKRSETPEMKARVKTARATRSDAKRNFRELRFRIHNDAALKQQREAIDERFAEERRDARSKCGVYWGCVDDQTEILTEFGWRTRTEFTGTERVATYNLQTNQLEWQRALGKTEAEYRGPMARVKNARLDMLLTPNHRLVVQQCTRRTGTVQTLIRTADEMPGKAGYIQIPQAAEGLEPDSYLDISPEMASVLGWIIAEGCFDQNSAGILLGQSHRVNGPYVDAIREDMTLAGVKFSEHRFKKNGEEDGMTTFRILAESGHHIRKIIPEKLLTPELVFRLTKESAARLMESLLFGDGHLGETSTGRLRWRWTQKNQQNVRLFQALALRLGHASQADDRGDGISIVSVRLQPYSTWQSQIGDILQWVDFEGTVWCPSTPNSTWVARRSGKLFVTGNSYLLAEAADDASRKLPLYDGATPNDPRFVSFRDASEQVGVQLQGGLASSDVFGSDTQIRIQKVDEGAWHRELTPKRCDRDRLSRTVLQLRVGSDASKKPIFAAWPMRMHRPLPPNSVIKTATVKRERIGPRDRWSLQITVDMSETKIVTLRPTIGGAVAIDIGWRLFSTEATKIEATETRSEAPTTSAEEISNDSSDEMLASDMSHALRVAAYGDENGNGGELRFDARLMSALKYADHLRGIRDASFAVALRQLAAFLKLAKETPAWLTGATANIAQWRSANRLAAVAKLWKSKAAAESDAVLKTAAYAAAYDDLEKWRYHDFHMWQWETSQRRKSILRRRDLFRCFAKDLALKYDTLILESFDLRVFAIRPPTDSDEVVNETARHHRQIAALSELRQTLINAFESRNRKVVIVSAVDTTRRCHVCGVVEAFDAVAILKPTCVNGHKFDQDERAWNNLLERWRNEQKSTGARGGGNDNDSKSSRESKWSRLKREKAMKTSARESAREAGGSLAE
jgi:hypothetical protein